MEDFLSHLLHFQHFQQFINNRIHLLESNKGRDLFDDEVILHEEGMSVRLLLYGHSSMTTPYLRQGSPQDIKVEWYWYLTKSPNQLLRWALHWLLVCIDSFSLKIEWHSTMLNRSGENYVT